MGSACASNFSTNDVNRTAFAVTTWSTDFKSGAVLPIFYGVRHSNTVSMLGFLKSVT